MPDPLPSPSPESEAEFRRLVADLLRKKGWKVLEQLAGPDLRPDLIAKRSRKQYLFKIKRASEGRRDRVVPLLSQAALEAAYLSRRLAGKPLPVAVVVANYIPEPIAEQAKESLRKITPDVADGPNSAILEQVTNGLAVRMAVLYLLCGQPGEG